MTAASVLAALGVVLVVFHGWARRPVRRVRDLTATDPWAPEHSGPTTATAPTRAAERPPSSTTRAGPRAVVAHPVGPRPAGRGRALVVSGAMGVVGVVLLGPLPAAVLTVSVPLIWRVRTVRATRAYQARRLAALPEAMELLVVAGAAGLSYRQGVVLVAERGPPELRAAWAEVVARVGAGEAWAAALSRLTTTIGEPARSAVNAIVAAERDGAPLTGVLSRLADDARRQRRHDLEAAVRRLPVRLSFPVVCCSLPAFVILTVVPLVAAGLRRLAPVGL